MELLDQDLCTIPEHMTSPTAFSGGSCFFSSNFSCFFFFFFFFFLRLFTLYEIEIEIHKCKFINQIRAPGGHIQLTNMIDTQQQYIKLNIHGEVSIIVMHHPFPLLFMACLYPIFSHTKNRNFTSFSVRI